MQEKSQIAQIAQIKGMEKWIRMTAIAIATIVAVIIVAIF